MACFTHVTPEGVHILIFVAGKNQTIRYEVRPEGRMEIMFGVIPTNKYRDAPITEDMAGVISVLTQYLINADHTQRVIVTDPRHIQAFMDHVLVPITAHRLLRKVT